MGTNVAMGLTVLATIGVAYWMFGDIADEADGNPIGLAVSVIGGLIVGWALGKTAEFYTSDHFGPVKKIAAQTETGPATTILSGISAGMMSVAASVVLILVGVAVAYWGGEQTLGADEDSPVIYGIAVAAIGMLGTTRCRRDRRRLRPDRRQRRRHRRDGRARPVGPRGHRRTRLARQHHRRDRKGFAVGSAALTASRSCSRASSSPWGRQGGS